MLRAVHQSSQSGRYFINERPTTATSWEELCIRKVAKLQGVRITCADGCQYGMEDHWQGSTHPINKPTILMTNMSGVSKVMTDIRAGAPGKCVDGRDHAPCTGNRAQNAVIYKLKLCRALLKGITNHFQRMVRCTRTQWELRCRHTMSIFSPIRTFAQMVCRQLWQATLVWRVCGLFTKVLKDHMLGNMMR